MLESNFEVYHVAIDGPASSGKGTVARELSKQLGIPCLDTGAIYRGIAVDVRDRIGKGSVEDIILGKKTVSDINLHLDEIKMEVTIAEGVTHISLDGYDVTRLLRENEISRFVTLLAVIPEVRAFCTAKSQEFAKGQSMIMEGRDIGSVVLPNARYKFYLTADIEVRAKRRMAEMREGGQVVNLQRLIKQMKFRDKNDMKKGGLKKVPTAIVVDSGKLTVDEVVGLMLDSILV